MVKMYVNSIARILTEYESQTKKKPVSKKKMDSPVKEGV